MVFGGGSGFPTSAQTAVDGHFTILMLHYSAIYNICKHPTHTYNNKISASSIEIFVIVHGFSSVEAHNLLQSNQSSRHLDMLICCVNNGFDCGFGFDSSFIF